MHAYEKPDAKTGGFSRILDFTGEARVMDEGVEIATGSGIGDTEQAEGAADSGGGYREGVTGDNRVFSSGAAKQIRLPLATIIESYNLSRNSRAIISSSLTVQ